jgi:hypothetical protein
VVFPGYFRTMRMHILRGRDFTAPDTADATRVVIVNEGWHAASGRAPTR